MKQRDYFQTFFCFLKYISTALKIMAGQQSLTVVTAIGITENVCRMLTTTV